MDAVYCTYLTGPGYASYLRLDHAFELLNNGGVTFTSATMHLGT